MDDMDKGVPDCPDCGGKGMCPKHNVEYLKWLADSARKDYEQAKAQYERITAK